METSYISVISYMDAVLRAQPAKLWKIAVGNLEPTEAETTAGPGCKQPRLAARQAALEKRRSQFAMVVIKFFPFNCIQPL